MLSPTFALLFHRRSLVSLSVASVVWISDVQIYISIGLTKISMCFRKPHKKVGWVGNYFYYFLCVLSNYGNTAFHVEILLKKLRKANEHCRFAAIL